MSESTFPYVHTFTDRHGKVRHYFRRKDWHAALPGNPGSAAFIRAYQAACEQHVIMHKDQKRHAAKKKVDDSLKPKEPNIGVYLLMFDNQIVYIGSSLNIRNRIADHRSNGRPFDEALRIGTRPQDRMRVEQALINALRPRQNRKVTNGERTR